jgi:Ca2+/H+ antiporter
VLLIVYGCYIGFLIRSQKGDTAIKQASHEDPGKGQELAASCPAQSIAGEFDKETIPQRDIESGSSHLSPNTTMLGNDARIAVALVPILIFLMVIASRLLVATAPEFVERIGVSHEFFGLILLPFIGNVASK